MAKSKWIPATDMDGEPIFPKKEDYYLITDINGKVDIDYFFYVTDAWEGFPYPKWVKHGHHDIVAWAKLPKPYGRN